MTTLSLSFLYRRGHIEISLIELVILIITVNISKSISFMPK